MWVAMGVLMFVLGGLVFLICRLFRHQGTTYGYVRDKRVQPGMMYRSVASVSIGGAPLQMADRYQLLLEREGQEPNWIDVSPDQYRSAAIGHIWHPDA